MRQKPVHYWGRFIGKCATDLKEGEMYECVSEWYDEKGALHSLSVIDESDEDYVYPLAAFVKLKDIPHKGGLW